MASKGEEALALHLRVDKILHEREVKLIPGRKWSWDFVVSKPYASGVSGFAIEIQGGTWRRGGHSTGSGIARDCEKANAAALRGYRTLFFTTEMVMDGTAINTIREALGMEAL